MRELMRMDLVTLKEGDKFKMHPKGSVYIVMFNLNDKVHYKNVDNGYCSCISYGEFDIVIWMLP